MHRMDRATVTLEGGTGLCHVNYRGMDRDAPCNQVAEVMRSEIRLSTTVRIVVWPDKTARFDEVGQLLQSLNNEGYTLEFPSR